MRLLIADDDPVSLRILETTLLKWGHEVVAVCDGSEAWQALTATDAPDLAILDWMMPGMDGSDICRRLREKLSCTYVILLTARSAKQDVVCGLDSGADDYLTKPFDREELRARVAVGQRVLLLQRKLSERVKELEEALAQVTQLQGLLPICAYCKKIRDDKNYWHQVESYVGRRSGAQFSHGICPECYERCLREVRK